jgi:LPXTG-site transpeptidase (sortase) family protein
MSKTITIHPFPFHWNAYGLPVSHAPLVRPIEDKYDYRLSMFDSRKSSTNTQEFTSKIVNRQSSIENRKSNEYLVIPATKKPTTGFGKKLGLVLVAVSLGGVAGPLIPAVRLESQLAFTKAKTAVETTVSSTPALPPGVPVVFNPLIAPDGSTITPVNTQFSLIVPKIGINAPVVNSVNPADPDSYGKALKEGVAHASTSYFPNQDGTVYLFSHSTNYDWFVKDLNAVFYLLKNVEQGDTVVIYYLGSQYTYKVTEKKIVSPESVSYLAPTKGKKRLILQTCWPPGSTTERLLIFADLVDTVEAK